MLSKVANKTTQGLPGRSKFGENETNHPAPSKSWYLGPETPRCQHVSIRGYLKEVNLVWKQWFKDEEQKPLTHLPKPLVFSRSKGALQELEVPVTSSVHKPPPFPGSLLRVPATPRALPTTGWNPALDQMLNVQYRKQSYYPCLQPATTCCYSSNGLGFLYVLGCFFFLDTFTSSNPYCSVAFGYKSPLC